MNLLATLALALVVGLSGSARSAQPTSAFEKAHQNTYHIRQIAISGGGECSATAIGPHALLTASHCEIPTDDLEIQGVESTDKNEDIQIVKIKRDGNDHSIYFLKNVTFKTYSNIVTEDSLKVGDDVFTYGNPGDFSDVMRKGYFASRASDNSLLGGGDPDKLLFDLNVWHGDSGSGIFDKNGNLVAVLSGMVIQEDAHSRIQLAWAFSLAFKQSVFNEARLF